MDTTLRGLDTADIPAWNRLLAAIEEVDRTGEHYNEADLAEEMANPEIEPGKDIVGAFDGDHMVGYYTVYARSAVAEVAKIHLDGGVRPDVRRHGIGSVLATAMRDRAVETHTERHPGVPALLTFRGVSDNAAQAALMKDIGLVPERWSFSMRADLYRPLQTPGTLPEGLELRRYDDSLAAAMHAAHNAAFVDHPNFTPWSDTMWRQWVTESRSFRPELSFVVVDPARGGEVVAYVQTAEYDAHQQTTGRREAYVGKVGTRREHRGRGLASTLLAHALHEYRNAGFDQASLDVDSENPTGALGIYERAGFEVATRFTDYIARILPGSRRARDLSPVREVRARDLSPWSGKRAGGHRGVMMHDRLRRLRDGVLVAGEYSANAAFGAADPRLRGSGATPQERQMVLPGDSILPWPSRQATRAVTIEAPSSAVWPWLVQAGYGRGGWYADMPWWRDPEGHRGRGSSSDRLIPEEQHIAVDQVLLDGPGCDETTGAWRVRTIRPASALVVFSSRTLDGREVLPGSAPPRVYFDCSWAFVLRPLAGATRLIVRTRVKLHPDNRPFRWLAGLFAVGDQAMQRAMLLGIKRRVEDTLVRTSGRPGATRASAGTVRGIDDHQTAVSRSRHRGDVRPRGLRGGPQPGVRRR